MPYTLTVTACLIYLALVALGRLAMLVIAVRLGGFSVSASRGGWIIVNTLMFCASFVLAWHIVMPFVMARFKS